MAPETPRAVSSKLLTMKFMQRAAASASPASDPPSSKRRKIDSPAYGRVSGDIDQASIQAALDDQDAKRRTALEQHTSADTHWVLRSTLVTDKQDQAASAPLNVMYVGYGEIDSGEDGGEREDGPRTGRTSTLKKKTTKPEKSKDRDPSSGPDDSSDAASDAGGTPGAGRKRKSPGDGSSTYPEDDRSRSRSRPEPSGREAKAKEMRDKRKKKEVRLNQITSISAGGGSPASSAAMNSGKKITCYNCQEPGHIASDCPKRKPRGPGTGR